VAKREDDFVPADPEIQQEVTCNLAGPQPLENVSRLDLEPTGVLSNELIGSIAAEKAVLFVVKPYKTELVLLFRSWSVTAKDGREKRPSNPSPAS
jgi:hypothetical protein